MQIKSATFGQLQNNCYLVTDEASGRSALQVKTLADEVEDRLSEGGVYPLRKEGQQEGRWVVLDYGTVLVHIFHTEEREFYRLDRLWEADNNRIALPFEESEEG